MKRIRVLAAGLLVFGGVLQIMDLFAPGAGSSAIIPALFGAAYLVIAVFLFRENSLFFYIGLAVPLAGMLLALATWILEPNPQSPFYIALDLVVAACCGYLAYRGQVSGIR